MIERFRRHPAAGDIGGVPVKADAKGCRPTWRAILDHPPYIDGCELAESSDNRKRRLCLPEDEAMHRFKTNAKSSRLGFLAIIMGTCLLAGCGTNPIVSWNAAKEDDGGLDSMAVARADAESLKQAFHARAEALIGAKVALNDSLLGLGVLTLGLATSNAHRDTYTTSAALAGTAYLFGNQNLQSGVLAAYQAGIGQVNCAVAAVRPMQVSKSDLIRVSESAAALRETLPELSMAIASADAYLASTPGLPTALTTVAQEQLEAARAAYVKASAANSNAADLPGAVTKAAGGLKGTLAEIHRSVNEHAAMGVADSSAVLASLKSLVSTITGFGKSVGVDVLTKAGAGAGDASQSVGDNQSELEPKARPPAPASAEATVGFRQKLGELAKATAKSSALADPLATQLDRYRTFDGSAELAKCEVITTPGFSVDRMLVSFTANASIDQSTRIVAKGGTRPYSGRFRDSPTFGIEVVNPYGQDSTFEVKVPRGVTGGKELTLSITDGASPPNEQLVKVNVVAASAEAKSTGGNQSDLERGSLHGALDRARGATFTAGSGNAQVRFTIGRVSSDEHGRIVSLSCMPEKPTTPPTRATVTEQLLKLLEATFRLSSDDAKAARTDRRQLEVRAPGCVR